MSFLNLKNVESSVVLCLKIGSWSYRNRIVVVLRIVASFQRESRLLFTDRTGCCDEGWFLSRAVKDYNIASDFNVSPCVLLVKNEIMSSILR